MEGPGAAVSMPRQSGRGASLSIRLSAVIVTATIDEPRVLTVRIGREPFEALPSGPLEVEHRTLEVGLRAERLGLAFARSWNEELVLERYELLYEAGLIQESWRDLGRPAPPNDGLVFGVPMGADHRRVLATAIGRLRGKIKYRPVVFELMPPAFTLLQLQRTVEALSGVRLHKQNFRRLVEHQGLVEETGGISIETGGRPARLVRFRREVLLERLAPGLRLRAGRRVTVS